MIGGARASLIAVLAGSLALACGRSDSGDFAGLWEAESGTFLVAIRSDSVVAWTSDILGAADDLDFGWYRVLGMPFFLGDEWVPDATAPEVARKFAYLDEVLVGAAAYDIIDDSLMRLTSGGDKSLVNVRRSGQILTAINGTADSIRFISSSAREHARLGQWLSSDIGLGDLTAQQDSILADVATRHLQQRSLELRAQAPPSQSEIERGDSLVVRGVVEASYGTAAGSLGAPNGESFPYALADTGMGDIYAGDHVLLTGTIEALTDGVREVWIRAGIMSSEQAAEVPNTRFYMRVTGLAYE